MHQEEYLLERRLIRRRSNGEFIERDRKSGRAWSHLTFPTWWHYDVLRGPDYLRSAGAQPADRVVEAIALLASKRGSDGRWPVDVSHSGTAPVDMDEAEAGPSRWNTLRALRVLDWYAIHAHTADCGPRSSDRTDTLKPAGGSCPDGQLRI